MHRMGEKQLKTQGARFYREGDPVVELLGSDLGNPGQCLVRLTLPLRPEAAQYFYMEDTASL